MGAMDDRARRAPELLLEQAVEALKGQSAKPKRSPGGVGALCRRNDLAPRESIRAGCLNTNQLAALEQLLDRIGSARGGCHWRDSPGRA